MPAAAMVHYFRADRPGQSRGGPDITPALLLFAQLRRYTLTVLGAAETATDFAGISYTDAPAHGEAEAVEPMEAIELEARSLRTLHMGPNFILVNVSVDFRDDVPAGEVENAIERLTREIREAHVDVQRVFIEAERSKNTPA